MIPRCWGATGSSTRCAAGADAAAGHGRLVLVTGEAGIGKTRLAQELAALVEGGALAWGRCVDTDGAPPFWPWRQVLQALHTPVDVPAGTADSPQDRFAAVESVAGSVLAQAVRPLLLIVLDDVHWADEASLLVIRQLADRAAAAPLLLLLATARVAEPGGPLARVLPDLHRAPGVELIGLRGLAPADVERQLVALGAGDAPAAQVHDATGGNPFFVREVARAVVDGTWSSGRAPRTVRDAVGGPGSTASPWPTRPSGPGCWP